MSISYEGGGAGGAGAGQSSIDLLNDIAYNRMMIFDNHNVTGQPLGNGYVTAFETDDQGPGSAASYDGGTATYDSEYAGRDSVGSIDIDVTGASPEVTSLTIGGVEALDDTATPVVGDTEYDTNDYAHTSDSDLQMAGAQTWCCQVKTSSDGHILSNSDGATNDDGLYLAVVSGNIRAICFDTGTITNIAPAVAASGAFQKIVMTHDGSTAFKLYIDDTEYTATGSFKVSDNPFRICAGWNTPGTFIPGGVQNLKNIEIYSGTPTDATDWVPGNTSSMSGTTLVMQSPGGSGNDNDQDITFTVVGDPVSTNKTIQESVRDEINLGALNGTWVATASGDTVTITGVDVGFDNNGKALAGVGTDVTFSNAVTTADGYDESPDGSGDYIGNIASPVIDITGETVNSVLVTFSHKWGEGSGTVGTDMVVEATKDGVTWLPATTVTDLDANLSGTTYKYYTATVDISALIGNSVQGRLRDLSTGKSVWFSMATYALAE